MLKHLCKFVQSVVEKTQSHKIIFDLFDPREIKKIEPLSFFKFLRILSLSFALRKRLIKNHLIFP
ncbi:hypothetical protein IW22_06935 [Chryseobacterium sp. JM1]|nr:hypothetical protein IW22_06935 [Chryseobacterium sp. JM1]